MTDDALIEAMARAICETLFGPYDPASAVPNLMFTTEAQSRRAATAALAAIRQTHAVVPKFPSAEMILAGDKAFETFEPLYPAVVVYRAMLAASEEPSDA